MKKLFLLKLTRYLLTIFIIMSACFSSKVFAGSDSFIGTGVGVAGVIDDKKIIFGSIEFRPGIEIYKISPWISMELADKIFYAALGLMIEFNITDKLSIIPSFGAGFFRGDDGIELGGSLQFKSSIELGYRFNKKGMLGISFGHISNGGIDDINPGSEFLKISYYFPFL